MIYTQVLNRGRGGLVSPLDRWRHNSVLAFLYWQAACKKIPATPLGDESGTYALISHGAPLKIGIIETLLRRA